MKLEEKQLQIDRTHGGTAPPGVLDFSASLNPLGPPPQALAAYHDAAAHIARYPPLYPHDLAARLARRHRVAPDNVVVGNGSTQLIHLLARTLRPRRAVCRHTDLQRNRQRDDRCGRGAQRDADVPRAQLRD